MTDDALGDAPELTPLEDDASCIQLLVANGYVIGTVRRRPASTEIECVRLDEFGGGVRYLIAFARDPLEPADLKTLSRAARLRNAQLVVISNDQVDGVVCVPFQSLIARMGGPIETVLPMRTTYAEELVALGRNENVTGIPGEPSTAYEGHVHAGLRFLLGTRVIRYGQDRRFEAVPDGFGFLPDAPVFLYDAKAARDGYNVDLDAIRQFADYARMYSEKYRAWLGDPFAFLVISSDFSNDTRSRQERSRELYAECRVPLAFLRSGDLAECVAAISGAPWARSAVNWRNVFGPPDITVPRLTRQLVALERDRVLH